MRYLFLLFFVSILYACQPTIAGEDSTDDRPNIVIILADDMGFSDLGCYGGEIRTPNLDRLAANGLRYRHFYNAARCCPTRASLLTGRYPHTAGMGSMVSPASKPRTEVAYQGFLREDLPTIAEQLRSVGYRAYMSGKWHVGEHEDYWPLQRGFERYFGLISGASSYYTIRKDQDRERRMVLDSTRWEPPVGENWYATTAYSDFAVEVVKDHDKASINEPFFLYLAYTAPHWPLHAPEETIRSYAGVFAAGWDSLRTARFSRQQEMGLIDESFVLPPTAARVPRWDTVGDKTNWLRKMQTYAAMVEEMDKGIGRLVAELEAKNELDNTLILFLSDNGGCAENVEGRKLNRQGSTIGAPGSYVAYDEPWAALSNTPYRRYKQWTEEGGIATPLIAHWPAAIDPAPSGGWSDQVGHVIDLLPTTLEAAEAAVPAELPGRSLLPSFSSAHEPLDRTIYWEHFGKQALRAGYWKMVRSKPGQQWRLYNLAVDATELDDLASAQPFLIDSLDQLYTHW
ncbi:MAG: arylsulfatase, partial [Bacteroidota bacterium]